MALLTHQVVDRDGHQIAFAAAAGGGDTYRVDDDRSILLVKNDHTSAHTVTLPTPGTVQGLAIAENAVVCANAQITAIPLYRGLYRDNTDGLLDITYSAVTALSVAIIRF